MRTECSTTLFEFAPVEDRKVVAGFDGGTMSSNAGGLLLGGADKAVKLVERVAQCFVDRRNPALIEHSVATLVGQRIFGLALGYEDLNDHDALRHDPLFAVLAGKLKARRADCAPVAGKSTLNRLERSKEAPSLYHKIACKGAAIEKLLVDLFLDSHRSAPEEIMLDLDATDDPLHGAQEGRFFHGSYDCYCYLPLYVFCGEQILVAKLRKADIDASAGAVDEIARVIAQIRVRWPKVRIVLRADSGFAREELMAWCEANDVEFLFGLAQNARLNAQIAEDLAAAAEASVATGKPARRFKDFTYSTLNSWSPERRVIGKAEWMTPSVAEADDTTQAQEGEKSPQQQSRRRAGRLASRPRQSALHRDVFESGGPRSARSVREALLRSRRDGKSHQGMSARSVRRPHLVAHDARQSAAALARLLRPCADERPATHRPGRHAPRRRHLRHDSPEAAQDRRPREDQRPTRPVLDGFGLSLRRRLRDGLGGVALGRLITPRPTGDLQPQ
jgi:hypothetical protein